MYDIDNGKPIINRSAEETNMGFCISHPVIFEKKVNEKMSIVTVMYKPGLVIVGADRRVNLVSTTQTSMQTNHIKVKYIEKFNAILSAVGSLKYKDIWWDVSPRIVRIMIISLGNTSQHALRVDPKFCVNAK